MKAELDAALVRDFPLLYGDRHASMQQTCMCWGFESGDGWEPLIRELSAKLEAIIAAMPEDERAECRASQVKEKYGRLRFYMSTGNDEIFALVDEAERKSATVCDSCSQPGKIRGRSWLSCKCDTCHGTTIVG